MKKFLIITISSISLLALGFVLGRGVNRLENIDSVSFVSTNDAQVLSYSVSEIEETFDESDRYQLFLTLHQSLIETHLNIKSRYITFNSLKEEVKDIRLSFRQSKLDLSYEDGITLWTNYHSLLDLREQFKLTIGHGYQKLEDLVGFYDLEHLDLIISTYQDVLSILNERLEILNQGVEILEESITVYQNYFNV